MKSVMARQALANLCRQKIRLNGSDGIYYFLGSLVGKLSLRFEKSPWLSPQPILWKWSGFLHGFSPDFAHGLMDNNRHQKHILWLFLVSIDGLRASWYVQESLVFIWTWWNESEHSEKLTDRKLFRVPRNKLLNWPWIASLRQLMQDIDGRLTMIVDRH